jgi:predicted lipoprotein with Yx(FWY)xxD motif
VPSLPRTARRSAAALVAAGLAAVGVPALSAAPATAATNGSLAYGLTSDNKIVSFRVGAPSTVLTDVAVSGLAAGEDLLGIDIRPATGQLYALGSTSRLYVIDPLTGVATGGAALSTAVSGTAFGVDFNPVVDRLRVVSDADQNLRVNVDTGATTVDGALAYGSGDAGSGTNPAVAAAAYTNSAAGATTTTLFDIDTVRDVLVTQAPPNNGTLVTVGSLGVDTSAVAGLDVEPVAGTAYAVLQTAAGSALYTVDLSSGAASAVGAVRATLEDLAVAAPRFAVSDSTVAEGSTATITVRRSGDTADAATVDYATSAGAATEQVDFTRSSGTLTFAAGETSKTFTVATANDGATEGAESFTVTLSNPSTGSVLSPAKATVTITDAEAGKAYGLTTSNQLVAFSVSTPGTITSTVQITGLQAGEDLVGIDVRPATGELFAVGSTSRLYVVEPATGAATEKAVLSVALSGTAFGVDFNPSVDRLRIVSNTGQNLRVAPDTGAVTVDGPLAYDAADAGAGTAPRVTGAAYTNNTAAATPTVLIDIDTARDVLVRQTPPNNGTLVTIGALGVDVSDTATVGIDISSQGGAAFAVLTPVGTNGVGLYRVDTGTGAVRLLGLLGNATVEDVALASVAPQQSASPSASPSQSASPPPSPSQAPGCTTAQQNLPITFLVTQGKVGNGQVGPVANATQLVTVQISGATPGGTVVLEAYQQNHFGTATFANSGNLRTAVADSAGVAKIDVRFSSNARARARMQGCAFGNTANNNAGYSQGNGANGNVLYVKTVLTFTVTRVNVNTLRISGDSLPARPGGLIVNIDCKTARCATANNPNGIILQPRANPTNGEFGPVEYTFKNFKAGERVTLYATTGDPATGKGDAQNIAGRSNDRSVVFVR